MAVRVQRRSEDTGGQQNRERERARKRREEKKTVLLPFSCSTLDPSLTSAVVAEAPEVLLRGAVSVCACGNGAHGDQRKEQSHGGEGKKERKRKRLIKGTRTEKERKLCLWIEMGSTRRAKSGHCALITLLYDEKRPKSTPQAEKKKNKNAINLSLPRLLPPDQHRCGQA